MAGLKDPVRDALLAELRAVRKMPGLPTVDRLAGKDQLIEALGMGDLDRAWHRLLRLRDDHGTDPKTDVGAYFYLSGWDLGGDSLDWRIKEYAKAFHCDERTGLRRGDRGAVKLTAVIRDLAETNRPWGLITVFQSGAKADFIVRLMMAYESWRPAEIRLNRRDISEPTFTLHKNPDVTGGYYYQLIVEAVPLDMSGGETNTMASLVVHWPMPVWPTWQTATHIADPRFTTWTRTFRDRGIELRVEARSANL
ncbi:hypothetical protein [Mycobacteroides abscessus]|uniref:hypothetical protein n=1 Tax=Mycobacteroides abscessus TaxID=36809 RepID=UPI0009A7E1AE|nr:hypothetical protein [Mycobacteroides abscessus]RIT44602.1 hypothetical protein D2E80_19730 [Mycobacteroides abscessus]SKT78950.1 Uncharacterised protein [Mycobacteroides abscessus subsp. massiliense]SKU02889.1 Uncharacterised protein [Mycobacteroides abscessus subsp. massiliense]